MKGLDTNVLVRHLVQDDAQQAALASRYIGRHCSVDDRCLINDVVLCELVWVLESAYDLEKEVVGNVLEKLMMTSEFDIESKNIAAAALRDYRASKADFADCLIGRKNAALGCTETATFDKALKSLDGFKLL
jgi:predicted nucleic-acid-binding protein